MPSLTLRQMEVLTTAVQAQSFARAAERLHVSPAAVSFQIKQTEGLVGFAVFERIGRRAVLTEAGRTLYAYARSVLQAAQDADSLLAALREGTGGSVSIGLISTSKYIVPHILARFLGHYPDITIHLRDGNRREIVTALEKAEIDMAVMGQPPPAAAFKAEAFARHPSVFVAAPTHPLAHRRQITPAELSTTRMIMREEGSGTRQLLEGFCASRSITLQAAMTSSSNETIKQAVMAGMGIAFLSRHTIGLELACGLLRILPVEGLPLMRSWFVAHRGTMPLLAMHAHLCRFFLEHGQAVVDEIQAGFQSANAKREDVASIPEPLVKRRNRPAR